MLIGSNIIYREKVSSTNELAAEMLAADAVVEGTIIYAGEQYGGKGQRGNKWVSEAGKNLTVSIILYPRFLKADQQFMISKVISLSIAGFLDTYSDSISIKWPNDIYHKDDKIAGILIENSLEGNKMLTSIIGAGININQDIFPPEIPNPVSLSIINKREYDIGTLMDDFCRICDIWYSRLRKGHFDYIDKQYTNRLYRLNTPSGFITDKGIISGKITGVDRFGRIKIETDNGNSRVYGFREIEFNA
ncbi:MAG: biotin--[acetyl-CoA-carboxylase] ligase [Bacteroidales bacterium]|nr:biotin--[acetyl-CoA-carboxylase] ligase [Bacteroidales bacterium]